MKRYKRKEGKKKVKENGRKEGQKREKIERDLGCFSVDWLLVCIQDSMGLISKTMQDQAWLNVSVFSDEYQEFKVTIRYVVSLRKI